MNTDFRALCAELIDALDGWHQAVLETGTGWVRPDETYLIDRARAALAAEPVAEGPTPSDEELLKLARAELNNSPNWEEPEYDASNPFPYEAPGIAWLNFARAVLARFGHQPAPAAEGEVAELVAWLRMQGEAQKPGPNSLLSDQTKKERHAVCVKLTRAAALLEQRHPTPVPVAVPEGKEPASVVGEPSDKELLELMHKSMRDDLAEVSRLAALQAGTDPGVFRVCLNYDVAKFARAVLARWGHKPAPAAEGEVAELVEFLRIYGDEVMDEYGDVGEHDQLTRAADLLEQLSSGWVVPTVEQFAPVPVSERLPGPGDCDAEGRCWFFDPCDDGWWWYRSALFLDGDPCPLTHWLPANALPLPQGEAES